MLQPIQGPRSNPKLPSAMQAFATGAAGAASDVARSYLNNKMQEMYDEKKTNRALAIEADARGRSAQGFTDFLDSAGLIPKSQREGVLASLSNMDQQQQSAIVNHLVTKLSSGNQSKRLSGIYGGLDGEASPEGQSQEAMQPANRQSVQPSMQPAPQPVIQSGTQATSQAIRKPLPPGVAPMLNREDMPAEAESVSPQAITKSLAMQQEQNELQKAQLQEQIPQASQGVPVPVQQAQEKPFNYAEEIQRINNETGRALNQTSNQNEINQILTARKNAIDMAEKRRAGNIAQAKLDIAEKMAKKELQELPANVRTQYEEAGKSLFDAENTLLSLDNIEEFLDSGAQMPEIVTSIRRTLGDKSFIAKFAEGLAKNDLANAVDTAKVQMFKGAKEIFGGQMRVSEFNEWIKKLPDISDPAIANKVKISLIRQFAEAEKFKYHGLKKAIDQDRTAPSDVILGRARNYTSKMSKKFFDQEKDKLNKLISSKGAKADLQVGQKVERDKLKSLPVGTKIKSQSGRFYEKTLNGFKEVSE